MLWMHRMSVKLSVAIRNRGPRLGALIKTIRELHPNKT